MNAVCHLIKNPDKKSAFCRRNLSFWEICCLAGNGDRKQHVWCAVVFVFDFSYRQFFFDMIWLGFHLILMPLCHFLCGLCEYQETFHYSLKLLHSSGVGTVDPSAERSPVWILMKGIGASHPCDGKHQRLKRQGNRWIHLSTVIIADVQSHNKDKNVLGKCSWWRITKLVLLLQWKHGSSKVPALLEVASLKIKTEQMADILWANKQSSTVTKWLQAFGTYMSASSETSWEDCEGWASKHRAGSFGSTSVCFTGLTGVLTMWPFTILAESLRSIHNLICWLMDLLTERL